jgi:tetratricopeptide (TPR) repeat protein
MSAMGWLLLIGLLIAIAIGTGLFIFLRRQRSDTEASEKHPATQPAADRVGATTIVLPGPDSPTPDHWYTRFNQRPLWRNAAVALGVVLLIAGFYAIYQLTVVRSSESFIVIVAPFDDGGDGQTGRNLADALARELNQQGNGSLTARSIDERPEDAYEALELAGSTGADLLIWGAVEPGAMLDSPAMQPRLIYTPGDPYAPNGWDGYLGRFAMPRSFTVAAEPINGQAVLVPLVGALAHYAQGESDLAYMTLQQLQSDYPMLNPPLPEALRGNVLWARGFYGEAEEAYRRALEPPSDERALLANNLGAILIDADDRSALEAFALTIDLLDGRDLGELRFNLGILALSEQRPADAAIELEQARNLLPPNAPLQLALAQAYRESGQHARAGTVLEQAVEQIERDRLRVAQVYRPMAADRFEAALIEQQTMLNLAETIASHSLLEWELLVSEPLDPSLIDRLRGQLDDAVAASEREAMRWRQLAASNSARMPGTDQTAHGQAEQAKQHALNQRITLALLDTEQARLSQQRSISAFDRLRELLLISNRDLGTGITLLDELNQRRPDDPRLLAATGRAYIIEERFDDAAATFVQLVQVAPQRPEGYYGQALLELEQGNIEQAAQFAAAAIERNNAFFPARLLQAQLAVNQGDWNTAIAQRRILADQRPGPTSSVALAQTLRLSGAENFPEAEKVLLPFSNTSPLAAIELGRLYNDAGRADAAQRAYNDALLLDPRSSTAAFELGETLAAQGDYDDAERHLRDALRFDEGNLDARLALANLYFQNLGRPDDAVREYGIALDQGIADIDQLIAIGDAALASGHADQAVKAYELSIAQRDNDPLLHHWLGQSYLLQERFQSAKEAEQRALELLGDDPNVARELRTLILVGLGDVAREQEDPELAASYYNQALELAPQQRAALIGLGQLAIGRGNWNVALGYFEQAISQPGGNDDAQAQFWLAEGLLRAGDYRGATSAYERVLAIDPDFAEAWLGLAHVQHAQNDPNGALETIDEAIRLRSQFAEALLFKGKLLQEQGRYNDARMAYDASIRANSRIAETYFRRGMLSIQENDYNRAINDLREATRLQANFPEAHYWLGRAYYARGNMETALKMFRQAAQLNGGYLEAVYYAGLAAEDLGRLDEARNDYQAVILSDADGEWGDRARTQLERMQ